MTKLVIDPVELNSWCNINTEVGRSIPSRLLINAVRKTFLADSSGLYHFLVAFSSRACKDSIQIRISRSDSIRNWWAYPLLVVVKRLKPLTVLIDTVYRLTTSVIDHMPVLFNVFEDWNEEFKS